MTARSARTTRVSRYADTRSVSIQNKAVLLQYKTMTARTASNANAIKPARSAAMVLL